MIQLGADLPLPAFGHPPRVKLGEGESKNWSQTSTFGSDCKLSIRIPPPFLGEGREGGARAGVGFDSALPGPKAHRGKFGAGVERGPGS